MLRIFIEALSATVRFKKILLLGDSIIAGVSKYLKVWQRCFTLFKALNSGIGGKEAENVLWRAINLPVLPIWFYYVQPTISYYTQILLRI